MKTSKKLLKKISTVKKRFFGELLECPITKVSMKVLSRIAKEEQDKEIKEFLNEIVKTGNINKINKDGLGLLHLAVKKARKDIVDLLLKAGAEVDIKLKDKSSAYYKATPLALACSIGNYSIAEMLIKKGADVNATDDIGWTPLHEATAIGSKEIAELLLKHGADINKRASYGSYAGWTALHIAISKGMEELVDLYSTTANLNIKTDGSWTYLHWAAYYGKEHIVEILINKGMDVNAKACCNFTPLHIAYLNKRLNIANILKKYGAKENIKISRGKYKGRTPEELYKIRIELEKEERY